MTTFKWTPDRIERAHVLWHKRIPDGRFVYASGEVAKMIGVSTDALLSKAKRLDFETRPLTGKRRLDKPRPPRSVKLTTPIPEIKIKRAVTVTSGELTCCRPMWSRGETPTHLYCGAVVAEGQYYCAGHGGSGVVFPDSIMVSAPARYRVAA